MSGGESEGERERERESGMRGDCEAVVWCVGQRVRQRALFYFQLLSYSIPFAH